MIEVLEDAKEGDALPMELGAVATCTIATGR